MLGQPQGFSVKLPIYLAFGLLIKTSQESQRGKSGVKKTIWVKKYPSVKAAISDYYRTIGRGHAFKEFRKLKMKTNDPHALVKKLDRYSEKGAKYGKELSAIIKFNKFGAYDTAQKK